MHEAIAKHSATIKEALAQPTTGDYAMGYGEGFNDACKPKAQPERQPLTIDEVWQNDQVMQATCKS
jgi:hypothetical protein